LRVFSPKAKIFFAEKTETNLKKYNYIDKEFAGADPTSMSYNVSVAKIYNTTNSLARF
jgi:hypothetical protein